MDVARIVEDFALGGALGALGGLFGIGGGLIAIPVLALLYHFNEQVAQGTALVMIVPNVVIGFWRYYQKDRVDLHVAALLAASAAVFTYLFAAIATRTDERILRQGFAAFIVLLAIYYTWHALRGKPGGSNLRPLAWGWTGVVGIFGGILSGLFGVGGATITPPALTTFFGFTQTQAQGLALALVTPGAFVALATYAAAGDVNWRTGIPLAVGGMVTVSAGVSLAHRLPDKELRLLFCGLLVVVALLLILT